MIHDDAHPWTAEETWTLVQTIALNGTKWHQVATAFPDRSIPSIRNRWNRVLRSDKLQEQARMSAVAIEPLPIFPPDLNELGFGKVLEAPEQTWSIPIELTQIPNAVSPEDDVCMGNPEQIVWHMYTLQW